jgi:hypothetical protein
MAFSRAGCGGLGRSGFEDGRFDTAGSHVETRGLVNETRRANRMEPARF